MLAPEMLDKSRCDSVGPAADYFSFGTLAVLMFTSEPFVSREQMNWDQIPKQWSPFIRACLSENPKERPKDFQELGDWLQDPDLMLTGPMVDQGESSQEVTLETEVDLQSLAGALQRVQRQRQSVEPQESFDGVTICMEQGLRALKQGRWAVAKQRFSEAVDLQENHAEANVSLAIACYELGDLDQAEQYYQRAKELNSQMAKYFREHIAFRV